MKILLVEDLELPAKIATTMLQGAGHTVDVATTGAESITLASQNEYQLVFMDVGLPDMDGFTAGTKIYELLPHIKIVGLTAHGIDDEFHEIAKNAHFIDIISKPLTKEYIDNIPSL